MKKMICYSIFWKFTATVLSFLSSANEVSTGPTCQIGCVFVCLCSVFPVFFCNKFSRLLIDLTLWFLAVVLAYRLFRTLNPAIQEIGWAMPHSDFLAHTALNIFRFAAFLWLGMSTSTLIKFRVHTGYLQISITTKHLPTLCNRHKMLAWKS